MSDALKLAATLAAFTISASAHAALLEPPPEQPRHLFCNVYLRDICFGIAQGDELTMRLPADYLLYEVRLKNGASIFIYNGFNPERPAASEIHKKPCITATPGGECHFFVSNEKNEINVYYESIESGLTTHIFTRNFHAETADEIKSFIDNMRACKKSSGGIHCSDVRPFELLINKNIQDQ